LLEWSGWWWVGEEVGAAEASALKPPLCGCDSCGLEVALCVVLLLLLCGGEAGLLPAVERAPPPLLWGRLLPPLNRPFRVFMLP